MFTPTNQRRTNVMTRKGVVESVHAHEVVPVGWAYARAVHLRRLVKNHIIKVIGGNHHIRILATGCGMADSGNDEVMPRQRVNKRRRVECPLCLTHGAMVEHAWAASGGNHVMRQVVATELNSFGTIPGCIVYANIARAYNERVRSPTVAAGFVARKWTAKIVRIHFERHVTLVPRRVVGKDIVRCEKILRVVDNEMKAQSLAAVNPTDQLESKTLTKAVTLMKMKQTLLKDLRACAKGDAYAAVTGDELLSNHGSVPPRGVMVLRRF